MYEVRGVSLGEIAKSFGVATSSVSRRARAEGWTQGKMQDLVERKVAAAKEIHAVETQMQDLPLHFRMTIEETVQERLTAEGLLARFDATLARKGALLAQAAVTPEELETTIRAIVTFRATAAVCYESGGARKLLYAAWRHGIRIPEQCSIAAFNDEEMLDYTIPPLTRIRIPAAEMGTETVRQLMNRISEKVEPKGSSLRFRGTLVEGGSIAPPPRE